MKTTHQLFALFAFFALIFSGISRADGFSASTHFPYPPPRPERPEHPSCTLLGLSDLGSDLQITKIRKDLLVHRALYLVNEPTQDSFFAKAGFHQDDVLYRVHFTGVVGLNYWYLPDSRMKNNSNAFLNFVNNGRWFADQGAQLVIEYFKASSKMWVEVLVTPCVGS